MHTHTPGADTFQKMPPILEKGKGVYTFGTNKQKISRLWDGFKVSKLVIQKNQ